MLWGQWLLGVSWCSSALTPTYVDLRDDQTQSWQERALGGTSRGEDPVSSACVAPLGWLVPNFHCSRITSALFAVGEWQLLY